MLRYLLLAVGLGVITVFLTPASSKPTLLINNAVSASNTLVKPKPALLVNNDVVVDFDVDGYPGTYAGEYLYGTYIRPKATFTNGDSLFTVPGTIDWYWYDPALFSYFILTDPGYGFSWDIVGTNPVTKYGTWVIGDVGEYDFTATIPTTTFGNSTITTSKPFAIVKPASMEGFYRVQIQGDIVACPTASGPGTYDNGSDISITAFGGNFQNEFDPTEYLYAYLLCYDSLIDDWYPVAYDSTSVGPASYKSIPFTVYGVTPGYYKFHVAIAGGAVWTESDVFMVTP